MEIQFDSEGIDLTEILGLSEKREDYLSKDGFKPYANRETVLIGVEAEFVPLEFHKVRGGFVWSVIDIKLSKALESVRGRTLSEKSINLSNLDGNHNSLVLTYLIKRFLNV
ncbi:hypothetical protein ThvES_00019490 [Thiovulum sp. ES]|nr:hypothetical protein ThvES_00019490 [Thiovulum sp. ES]